MTTEPHVVVEPGTRRIPHSRRGTFFVDAGTTQGRQGGAWRVRVGRKLGGPRFTQYTLFDLRRSCKCTEWSTRASQRKRGTARAQGRWSQRVENSADVRLEVLREGSRPPGVCGANPGVATRDSCYSGGGPGSRLACCRCDARVRPQQRGCGVLSPRLRIVQRSIAELQQRGEAWGRQAGP